MLLRIEGNDIFQWMERLGSVGDATLAARVEELFDGETSALLVIDDGASFGALREALRVARARERGLPLYLRGALAIEDVEGTVDVAPRLEDLTLARLGTRRPGEPIPLSFTATRQGIVVSAGALVQGEECSIYDLPPDSATPSPAIRPPSDGSAEEALWVCLGGLAQTAGEVRSIWIGGEADVPANHVIWLGSFLSHQDVFPNATVYLSLADPFWLEGQ
ncbi:MAG: hypothetical protein M5U28_19290 [Sandaracinaceae bacterium]|nr:hypothetical protein [Sandaracinaceae bacterium]